MSQELFGTTGKVYKGTPVKYNIGVEHQCRPAGKMVIKKLLNKVNDPKKGNSAQVQQLRDKLAKLKDANAPAAKPQSSSPAPAQPAAATPPPAKPPETGLEALQKASEAEQRKFAQQQDPKLILQEEKTRKLMAKQMGELISMAEQTNKRIIQLEKEKKANQQGVEKVQKRNEEIEKKMNIIDQRLEKFMGLYEVITNKYNPFAGSDQVTTPPSAPVSATPSPEPTPSAPAVVLSDNLTGQADAIPVAQGRMSSENAQKLSALLAELEEQERLESDPLATSPTAEADVEENEDKLQPQVIEQIHAMLADFETRMQAHIDASLQAKMHDTFEQIEAILNQEVDQAIHEEVEELKDNEDIISSALKELEQLEVDVPAEKKEVVHEQLQDVREQIQSVDDQIRAIPPSLYFRLKDGRILKSVDDLLLALQTMPDTVFAHHVGHSHNHFADWLELALNDPRGQQLRDQTREQMVQTLKSSSSSQ